MKTVLGLLLIAVHSVAFGFEEGEDCMEGSGSTYTEACLYSKEARKLDRELNAKYQQVVKMYRDTKADNELTSLIKAQRAWIRLRNRVCDMEQQEFGGINSVPWARCNARMTSQRLWELNQLKVK